ncbi:MAG: hypothetical protein ACE5GW_14210, partial [Planctomycetota bacterium]
MRCPEALLTAPVAVPALVLLILFFAGSSLGAQILQVPADYPTIQEAIDAAQGGDTVLVAPGTYFENIDFLGKAITVTSILGPEATTVDGGGSGSVASFVNGEGQDSLLSGFTITHGRSFSNVGGGGGIRCLFSAPTIEDCRVTDNISDEGAGLRIAGFHPNPLVIRNCTFTGNHSFVNGGAARLDFVEAEIEDCVFAGNTALRRGGGLYLQGGPVTFLRCDIANNTGHYWGGGLYVWDGNVTLE